MTLMTDRLKLRPLEREDLRFVHELDNNETVMHYWFEEPYESFVELEELFNKHIHDQSERRFIIHVGGEQRVGLVELVEIDQLHRRAEFLVMVAPDHQGRGYATAATRLAISYAFKVLNLYKLYLLVDVDNAPAIHIYERDADRNPGDEVLPGRVAPNVECRLVDAQEAQLDRSSRHRPPGQDCFNLRERQRRPSLYIADTHIAQRQIGVDAVPAGFDATDTDRLAEMLADHLFDVGSIGLDIGQDAIAQQQHQCDEAEIDDPENPDQGAPKTRSVAAREERNQRVESVVKRWPQLFRAHHQTITCGSLCLSSGRVTRMACSIESVEGAIVPGNG